MLALSRLAVWHRAATSIVAPVSSATTNAAADALLRVPAATEATDFFGVGGLLIIGIGGQDLRQRRERAYAVTTHVTIRAIARSTRQRPTAAAKRACCSGCGVGASGAFSSGFRGTSSRTQPRTHHPRRTARSAVTAMAAAVV